KGLATQAIVVRSADGAWQRHPLGLDTKQLSRDMEGRVTSLVRMAPGLRYPSHRHASTEELFLLSGDLTVDGELLGAGDYCAAPGSTIHRETWSAGGCTFVLAASEADEIVDASERAMSSEGLIFSRLVADGWRPGVREGATIRKLRADQARGIVTA